MQPVALGAIPAVLGARHQLCPAPCSTDPRNWTPYTSLDSLNACDHPILLDFSAHGSHGSLGSPEPSFKVLTCMIDDNPDVSSTELTASGDGSSDVRELNILLDQVQAYLTQTLMHDSHSLLWQLNTVSLGIYSGTGIDNTLTTSFIQGFQHRAQDIPARNSAIIELCGGSRDVEHTFGMAVGTAEDMDTVKSAVDLWSQAQCTDSTQRVLHIEDIPDVDHPMGKVSRSDGVDGLSRTFTCVKETVVSGDTCATLAEKCGVSAHDFMIYNPKEGLCATLQPGQEVCCSDRRSLDNPPDMNEDGSCAMYTTQPNETCLSIANDHYLDEPDIRYFNDGRTWGWSGCDLMRPGLRICLSDGYPPVPAPEKGATCGPTVPETERPSDGTPLAELNPCPLNACCNTLGNCGVSPQYCIYEKGPTGNPGTAPPGHKGCISNCGLEILDNSDEPDDFMRIGYYESFNFDRPCLNLRTAHINIEEYTHIHWGFATINSSFHIGVNDTFNQWDDFLALEGVKRIISFGGWGYSINFANYDVLREAMAPENVDSFVVNIMSFVEDNDLDGVYFDWEYPGASDVPSVSLGLMSDGPNYLEFLKKLRKAFRHDKSVSIAAPACYWYLKVFPLEEMSHHLDYIVYMTYDLHGQWDYASHLAQDWCGTGNCLRSHVTKAGVPRNIIAVGVASYGRAFGMSEAGCTWPECTFKGPTSAATPGMCTMTPGILANAEIENLIAEGGINEFYYDAGSDSNILVYNDTQWVAFMNKSTIRGRTEYYKDLKFAGYANWAVDLAYWSGDDGDPGDDSGNEGESNWSQGKNTIPVT
ncbi:glycoside hydrolase superfamily [Aspergillus cavernicola]|uniref:chitinase n=1 Tax=Aspergillus cavernicola TaxID=176166 RepID=A0ABR4HTX0_9EURO